MSVDERTPVLVGGAQLTVRDAERDTQPLELMEEVARRGAAEAGLPERALRDLDAVALVDVMGWRPQNGPRLLAERLGAQPAFELTSGTGGETPLPLVGRVAGRIAAGEGRLALVAGSHNLPTLFRARARGERPDWGRGGEGTPGLQAGEHPGSSEHEMHYGLRMPVDIYPVYENALRARRGLDLETHRRRMGELMHRFTKVAAANPHAWFPTERSAEELTTVTEQNRMIAFPYPKFLNSVMQTEQAAAIFVTSVAHARALGIPEDRWVYWWGGGHAVEDPWFPTERPRMDDAPALPRSVEAALAPGSVSLDAVDHFDFYSCFPVAVEMACEMLGLAEDDPRGFTVTGGLPYAGGPGNNYTLHSLVEMARRVRLGPGRMGLVTGNGWYFTKHSAALVSSVPPEHTPSGTVAVPAPEPADLPTVLERAEGPGRVEAYTVLYERDGAPTRGIVVGRLDSGERFLANTPDDRALLETLVESEVVGIAGAVHHDGERNRFTPR